MSDHTHRILRNYRRKLTSTSYTTILTETSSAFFGAGTVASTDKWIAYGIIEGVLARPSTGGDGQRLPFMIVKAPGSYDLTLTKGALMDILGTSAQFIDVAISGTTNFAIQGRLHSDNGSTGILSVTLDLLFVGGTGPTQ